MSVRIPLLVPRTGHPYVPVVIRWKEAGTAIESAFVVDTGAPDLLLSQHDAESLGARLTELPLSRRTLSGLGGCARAFEMRDLEFVFFSEDGQPALFRRGLVNVAENPMPKNPGHRQGSIKHFHLSKRRLPALRPSGKAWPASTISPTSSRTETCTVCRSGSVRGDIDQGASRTKTP